MQHIYMCTHTRAQKGRARLNVREAEDRNRRGGELLRMQIEHVVYEARAASRVEGEHHLHVCV